MKRKLRIDRVICFISIVITLISIVATVYYHNEYQEVNNKFILLNSTYVKNCIMNSSNVIQTTNQEGDINIEKLGDFTVNQEIPEPRVEFNLVEENIKITEGFQTKIFVSVDSLYPLPQFAIIVGSPSLKNLEIIPLQSMVIMGMSTQIVEGYGEINFQLASGDYVLSIITENPEENIDIAYRY